jgi:phospholipid N-methyltransferase
VNFFFHFVKNLKKTGAVAPSSKFLAGDLIEPFHLLTQNTPSFNVLELGPGTGPLTLEIFKQLRSEDHLDLVEAQEKFFNIVSSKFHGKNIAVHFNDFLKFQPERRYKLIISSLPYDNMPRPIIKKIW